MGALCNYYPYTYDVSFFVEINHERSGSSSPKNLGDLAESAPNTNRYQWSAAQTFEKNF
jgi:hypothetical protein